MALVTRTGKGSKLTIAEMDGNLEYLESNGFVDGEYSQTKIGTGEIIGSFLFDFPSPPTIISSLITSGATGSYTVSPIGGSGTGAQFELVVGESDRGGFIINALQSSVTDGGSGYAVDDELTVPCSDLGGTTGDVVFTLLEGAVDVTQTSTVTIEGSNIKITTPTLEVTGSFIVSGSLQANSISGESISGESISTLPTNPSTFSLSANTSGLRMSNLPTTAPGLPGFIWNDSGSLKISTGSFGGPGAVDLL